MSDFFKKLNVLVKASVNELLGDDSVMRRLSPAQLGKGIDQEVTVLRQRINEALDYEEELTKRVQDLQAEADRWDNEADRAVEAGQDEQARYAVENHQRAQQRLTMAESDLREHQLVTQDLIMRVNELDAAVADARRAEAEDASSTDTAAEGEPSVSKAAADVLREMRQKVSEMNDLISAREEVSGVNASDKIEEDRVDDDLAHRRDRLSKK
ncbi:MAG: hypothetical protein K8L99_27260 [Anaerolineae bacterium]|nr:hypothetical protein [Anaerolineae bacterium]